MYPSVKFTKSSDRRTDGRTFQFEALGKEISASRNKDISVWSEREIHWSKFMRGLSAKSDFHFDQCISRSDQTEMPLFGSKTILFMFKKRTIATVSHPIVYRWRKTLFRELNNLDQDFGNLDQDFAGSRNSVFLALTWSSESYWADHQETRLKRIDRSLSENPIPNRKRDLKLRRNTTFCDFEEGRWFRSFSTILDHTRRAWVVPKELFVFASSKIITYERSTKFSVSNRFRN